MDRKNIENIENTKTPKTSLRDRCERSWDHVRPWHAREYPQCGLQSPEKPRGWLPALAQKRPIAAYADRHEDIVDIDALVERPVHTATVGHGRQSRWRS